MDTSVTLLEIHKLLYLLQNTGEDLRLRYVKAEYGPYSENLKFVLKTMENYYITGYSGASENPRQEIELIPGALQDASEFLRDNGDAVTRIETVSKVMERKEEPVPRPGDRKSDGKAERQQFDRPCGIDKHRIPPVLRKV